MACVVLAMATAGSACGRWPCGRTAYDRPVATATTGAGPWREASVNATYSPAHNRGNGSFSESEVAHSLVVRGAGGEAKASIDSTRPATSDRCEQPFVLSFSPDGLVLAISQDGGRSFRYAGLEGGQILYTHHAVVTSQPWAPGPTTKQLAIDALGRLQRLPATQRTPGVRQDEVDANELEGAARFACARLEDPELRRATADALANATTWLAFSEPPVVALLRCSATATRNDPAWRATVQSALSTLARDPAGRRVLEPYAAGCHAGPERPGDAALWCLAQAALGGSSPSP